MTPEQLAAIFIYENLWFGDVFRKPYSAEAIANMVRNTSSPDGMMRTLVAMRKQGWTCEIFMHPSGYVVAFNQGVGTFQRADMDLPRAVHLAVHAALTEEER